MIIIIAILTSLIITLIFMVYRLNRITIEYEDKMEKIVDALNNYQISLDDGDIKERYLELAHKIIFIWNQ